MAEDSISYVAEDENGTFEEQSRAHPPANKGQRALSLRNYRTKEASRERKKDFLKRLEADPGRTYKDIAADMGLAEITPRKWGYEDKQFQAAAQAIRRRAGIKVVKGNNHKEPPKTFVERRELYFGFDTPWFQQKTVDAYERAGPGDIVLCLQPPEHGKTSLTEDHLTDHIGQDHNTLITVVSEGINMARKISNRVRRRLEANGPTPEFVQAFGPFEGQHGDTRLPWGADFWSVWGSNLADQRDYTMAIGGWNSAIAGTRSHWLHVDDIMSLRNYNQTPQVVEKFRQDMLSRPGETGKTTVNGTRVGDRDFYEWMDREFGGEDFYQKIEFPAIVIDSLTGDRVPLWQRNEETGAGYTMEMLERLRKKVGEDAWWRNYMQKPKTSTLVVFSDEGIQKCENHYRSLNHRRDQMLDVVENDECWITLDPSIGGINTIAAMHPGEKLMLLDMQEDTELPRNSAIAEKIRMVASRLVARGWRPTMLVIETMAFQKGLQEDEAIKEVADEFGMRIEGHLTGNNKYDENVGVPSMASSFESGSVDLPYADDYSRHISDVLTAQLRAWKPVRDSETGKLKYKRGNQLRQDQLMALWFGWIWWIQLKSATPAPPQQELNVGGLRYGLGRSGLFIPSRS